MVKNSNFFELFDPPYRIALADLDGSTLECAQVCALHIDPHLATLRKIEMIAVRSTNETVVMQNTAIVCRPFFKQPQKHY